MDKRLILYDRNVVVTYSKKKRMGRISAHIPKKFVGFNGRIIIFSKAKRKKERKKSNRLERKLHIITNHADINLIYKKRVSALGDENDKNRIKR